MPQPIISAKGVNKSYTMGEQKLHVLKDVDFSVSEGEMVAIVGSSGSGKTTMLNCLSALDDIDSGEVVIDEIDIHRMKDHKRAAYRANNMSFIFQSFNLIPVLTAYENVEMPLLLTKLKKEEIKERVNNALEAVGLGDRKHHYPNQLSGGQAQRVAIARAIANEPKIIWADEPTGNLDSKTGEEVLDVMIKLKEQGNTFVVVTHDMDVASQCDRIVKMVDGKTSNFKDSKNKSTQETE